MEKKTQARERDKRAEAVAALVKAGKITSLLAIVDIMPLSAISTLSGIHYTTVHKKFNAPNLLKIEEIVLLADVFGLTPHEILTLAINDIKAK